LYSCADDDILLLLLVLVASIEHGLVNGAVHKCLWVVIGSGGNVICNECPGRELNGQRTLTRRLPAWTVNSAPCCTPGGTVTRYTCDDAPDDIVDRVTVYAPGRLVALFWQVLVAAELLLMLEVAALLLLVEVEVLLLVLLLLLLLLPLLLFTYDVLVVVVDRGVDDVDADEGWTYGALG